MQRVQVLEQVHAALHANLLASRRVLAALAARTRT
jgi:hypothetical protein